MPPETPANLAVGTRLGHHEILGLIGVGGMGQVYRARDTKLQRDVALKLLPAGTAVDPERRQRFEREARAVASLNHPNIVTIHSVDEADGQLFLTMELVEGQMVSALIRPGGLPVAQLLDIAVPLADAVSAAHARGITHRDLKPANVMVTPGRQVKVLDFGLAKPFDVGGVSDAMATEAPQVITGQGRILGTVAYMAPEQAEGKAVDARSDIFSLGVMLYEMATGVRPFGGDTSLSTLTAIMRDTPKPVTEVNPAIPKELGRVIRRALSKDPDRRQQTGKDLRNDLDEIRKELESGELSVGTAHAAAVLAAAPIARRTPWVVVAGGLALVIAVGAGVVWSRRASTAANPIAAVAPVSVTVTSLTTEDGLETFPSLSPDGKWIVYAADEQVSGQTDILLRAVGGQTTINLTRDSKANDTQPAFSPDGERIAFRSERDGGGLFVMGRTGESVRRLTTEGFTPSWSPDGTSIVYGTESVGSPTTRNTLSTLRVVSVASGEQRRLTTTDSIQPAWSPHGQRIAYWGLPDNSSPQRDLWTVAAGGGDPVRVTNDASNEWSPAWSPDGHYLYFSSDRSGSFNVWRIAISEATGQPAGSPEPVTVPRQNLGHLSFSADGTLLALSSNTGQSNIEALAFDPMRETVGSRRRITNSSENTSPPSVSGDGKWLAFYRNTNGQDDLWIVGTDGHGLRQLTNDAAVDRRPTWSPDGKRLMFDSTRSGTYQVWTIASDGGGLTQVTNEPGLLIRAVGSPDGARAVAYMPLVPKALLFDPRLPAAQQKVEELPPFPGGTFAPGSWSPDGSRIVGYTQPGAGIWVYSITTRVYQQLASTGTAPTWLPDSRRLLFSLGGKLMLMDSATKVSKQLFASPRESVGASALSPDAREIYVGINNPQMDIVLARLTGGGK